MQTLSYSVVVEELVAELAERRRAHAAYLALARAILRDDDPEERIGSEQHAA